MVSSGRLGACGFRSRSGWGSGALGATDSPRASVARMTRKPCDGSGETDPAAGSGRGAVLGGPGSVRVDSPPAHVSALPARWSCCRSQILPNTVRRAMTRRLQTGGAGGQPPDQDTLVAHASSCSAPADGPHRPRWAPTRAPSPASRPPSSRRPTLPDNPTNKRLETTDPPRKPGRIRSTRESHVPKATQAALHNAVLHGAVG